MTSAVTEFFTAQSTWAQENIKIPSAGKLKWTTRAMEIRQCVAHCFVGCAVQRHIDLRSETNFLQHHDDLSVANIFKGFFDSLKCLRFKVQIVKGSLSSVIGKLFCHLQFHYSFSSCTLNTTSEHAARRRLPRMLGQFPSSMQLWEDTP